MVFRLPFRRNELVNSDFSEESFGTGPGTSTGLQFCLGHVMVTAPDVETEDNELNVGLKTS